MRLLLRRKEPKGEPRGAHWVQGARHKLWGHVHVQPPLPCVTPVLDHRAETRRRPPGQILCLDLAHRPISEDCGPWWVSDGPAGPGQAGRLSLLGGG